MSPSAVMRVGRRLFVFAGLCSTACGGGAGAVRDSGGGDDGGVDGGGSGTCTTRISYSNAWIKAANHPDNLDVVNADVTWDGTCTDDGANSYALLSNGFKPYFRGRQACGIALDKSAACGAPVACSTRITYAATWIHGANHPDQFDDATGRVFWDGVCINGNTAHLSNTWAPHFTGTGTCGMSMRWSGCGGLYANPVVPANCPDPGVVRDGNTYVMTCTSGNAQDAFPMYTSNDLVTWTSAGHVLPQAAKPSWATGDFWAPEIHKVGTMWIAYFSARGVDGKLAIGAAYATSVLGPYTAHLTPLVHSDTIGLIDASAFFDEKTDTNYLLWKEDGNAQSAPTPIRAQQVGPDGLSLTGATSTLITNDQPWEGNLVEGPFMVEHAGSYYLFYSGNAYYDARYAVGVARATSPLGPYMKLATPIVTSSATWVGPGHGSVVAGPGGDTYIVYHSWQAGHVNGPGDPREVLVDQVQWRTDGWPEVFGAPSTGSRPLP
jgi:arabinan endo-1,5-alpha-L-arabinosidase